MIKAVGIMALVCLWVPCAEAQNLLAVGSVKVRVRALEASNLAGPGEVQMSRVATQPVRLDPNIADLRSKLSRLNFRSYKLISVNDKVIPLTKRGTITFNGGDTLNFRPLYMENDKVGMWLRWEDKQGISLLDTRVHFAPGESFVTGTDSSNYTGLILAIDVKAQ